MTALVVGGQRFKTVENVLGALTPDERRDVLAVLDSPRPAEAVATTFLNHGWAISASTVRTYRRLKRAETGDNN